MEKVGLLGVADQVNKKLVWCPRILGCEKLTGQERYHIRQGHYRIVYSIQDNELTVWIVKVTHRKSVYR